MAIKCPKCQTENPVDSKFCRECAAPLTKSGEPEVSVTRTLETTPDELTRGFLFAGRYEIIEELGAGGMGKVYRAFDKKLQEEIALKMIRPEIGIDKRTVERFHNEIKVARKISHKNVCRVHDLGEEEKSLFISMEYVRGEDLKSFIWRAKQLSVGTAISIASQVAEGLGEAHRLGVVHRDLKPGNIMIGKDGNAKIMDFGIARSLAVEGLTREGAMIGTEQYMSPEQVDGKVADARSDIYALGVILFEMVTGRAPFEGETPMSIAHKHKYEPAPDPQKLNPQIPGGLRRIILRSLEKDPGKRYQTTEEVLADLVAVEAALPKAERIIAKPKITTPREITVKFRPRKLIIPASALILVIALAIALLKFLPKKAAPPSHGGISAMPSVAILYFKNNTGDRNLDMWRDGLCTLMISKLQQSRFIRVVDQSQMYSVLKKMNLLEQGNYTSEDLKEIASHTLATHVVRGSLTKAGDRYRIELTVQNAPKLDLIAAENADGTGEGNILTMVDDLAERLKAKIGLSSAQIATDINPELGSVLTTSTEALKLYVQGYQASLAGFVKESIDYFEKAIALDPQFAMAYLWLAQSYNFYGRMKECRMYSQKAFDLRERVPERERYYIEGNLYSLSDKTWDKAMEAYSKLVSLYPEDLMARELLAVQYFYTFEWDKAIEQFELLRRYKTESIGTYGALSWCYIFKDEPDKAGEVLQSCLKTVGENGFIRANLGVVYCILGDLDKARKEIDIGDSLNPHETINFKRFYLLCTRDFPALELLYKDWEASPLYGYPIGFRSSSFAFQGRLKEARARFEYELGNYMGTFDPAVHPFLYCSYGHFLEKTGDAIAAISACETAVRMTREAGSSRNETMALYYLGIAEARQGKLKEATRTAEELRRAVENSMDKKRIRLYEGLLAAISLQRHDVATVRDHIQKALSRTAMELDNLGDAMGPSPHSGFLYCLAEAYEQAGRWPEARKAYEDVLSLKTPIWFEPANVLIFVRSHYRLGMILERLGDKAGAAANYRKFLELWRNADPDLPEVEDAKKRLSALGT